MLPFEMTSWVILIRSKKTAVPTSWLRNGAMQFLIKLPPANRTGPVPNFHKCEIELAHKFQQETMSDKVNSYLIIRALTVKSEVAPCSCSVSPVAPMVHRFSSVSAEIYSFPFFCGLVASFHVKYRYCTCKAGESFLNSAAAVSAPFWLRTTGTITSCPQSHSSHNSQWK